MPKSSAERSTKRRQRLKEGGLKEVRNVWVRPEHEAALRAYATMLRRCAEARPAQASRIQSAIDKLIERTEGEEG